MTEHSKKRGREPEPPEPLAAQVIDSHAHLDISREEGRDSTSTLSQVLPVAQDIVAQARAVNVARILQIGVDVTSSEISVALAHEIPEIAAAVALHPNEPARIVADQGPQALALALARIDELAADPRVRAIGETGMDFFRTPPEGRQVQEESFRAHIGFAKKHNKTLVIHDREAHEAVLATLRDAGAPERVVFHCFSGDVAMARECAAAGWYLSFAGVLTFKNADVLREAFLATPLDRVLVETDAPFLTPVPYRGKANASWLVPLIVRQMAALRELSEEEMCHILWENTQQAFGAW